MRFILHTSSFSLSLRRPAIDWSDWLGVAVTSETIPGLNQREPRERLHSGPSKLLPLQRYSASCPDLPLEAPPSIPSIPYVRYRVSSQLSVALRFGCNRQFGRCRPKHFRALH